MTGTNTLRGHQTARALAQALASMRAAPPSGAGIVSTMDWARIHSIRWRSGRGDPRIVFETSDLRRETGGRTRIEGRLTQQDAARQAFDAAWADLCALVGDDAVIDLKVMVAYPGWELTAEPMDGEPSTWHSEESLAVTSAEWPEFIVQRDADERDRGMYAANSLLRASVMLDRRVAADEDGYHKHWTRVDAEILRRIALREHPGLDDQRLSLVPKAA